MVTADFKRLNILLPRFSEKEGRKVGKKVATATMSTAKIEACLGKVQVFSCLLISQT